MSGHSLVWFRNDLRIDDNPALRAAVDRGQPLVAVYVLDEDPAVARPHGGASRWWLHHSLTALDERLRSIGGRLILRSGSAPDVLAELIRESDIEAVFWNRRYGKGERDQDAALKKAWREQGLDVTSFAGSLLYEPWNVTKEDGEGYAVYSAYWRAAQASAHPRDVVATPRSLHDGSRGLASDDLDDWGLLPSDPDWSGGLAETWAPGEETALTRLHDFLSEGLHDYDAARDRPGEDGTTRLSPHLRFGEISPHRIWHEVHESKVRGDSPDRLLSELGWREFNYSLLYRHDHISERNIRPEFDDFPWKKPGRAQMRAWEQGRTGLPLVDAGMRQLWQTGWMHNRVRMVTASFLIKNLLVDWREGEQWFWDTLVDADPANNAANWQWVAGSGVDAAPFFRVFNPVTQSKKFDPDGAYIRRWVEELADIEAPAVHEPAGALDADGYPAPMVDLKETRRAALDAFSTIKR
ncbi:MAG: deoxyribodipyrimidine photo-lyase [Naasia sp.]